MGKLDNKIIWVTGAGSGIGEATSIELAASGATVVLTGRRLELLKTVADKIHAAGGDAVVAPADLTDAPKVQATVDEITSRFGKLDILINNAGINIRDRSTAKLTPEGVDTLVSTNLSAAFYCVTSTLPIFRRQGGGLMIHTASWLGRYNHKLAGAAYSAAKHAVVAMSHAVNMEEFSNNIRSCVICPGEVATPVLDNRPVPVPQEERDRMLQPQDLAEIISMICNLPDRVCLNEILISPTWNRMFLSQEQSGLVAGRQQ
ncbi:SDR family oxidoreductase [Falsochrobactrum sp. TDYN1]|uniref:SDR family oxidoreductase n=1 Tax=Falsochrobactrum tianjinense TaxID=2706015 RepID=A0A949UUG8_9HYPH|nr:SDR family oxidoreductase [Falsochrobactrum sp. TDYN1]MBV2144900.1 SDR family oxidoreductase [Falsochrobactrum sp. TDYN1]